MCERWESSVANFYADMGPRPSPEHSIERRNNNGGYTPENCFWGTDVDQNNNKRGNHFLIFEGRTQTVGQWARETGLEFHTITGRLRRGWSVEEALTTPVPSRK